MYLPNCREQSWDRIFFILPFKNESIKVLITNYHIIDDNYLNNKENIELLINDKKIPKIIKIDYNRKIYSSKQYDIMIIKLKEIDEIHHFLELDNELFNYGSEIKYKADYIYTLHCPFGKNASVSYAPGFENIDKYEIQHRCNTEAGSSGSPILRLSSNKVIGIHKGFIKEMKINLGTFLKYIFMELNDIKSSIKISNLSLNSQDDISEVKQGKKNIYSNLKYEKNSEQKIYCEVKQIYRIEMTIDYNKTFKELRILFLTKIKRTDLISDKNVILSKDIIEVNPSDKIVEYYNLNSTRNFIEVFEGTNNIIENEDLNNVEIDTEVSKNENEKIITIKSTAGHTVKISIELNKTWNELIKIYYPKIKKPELINDPNCAFLFEGSKVPKNRGDLLKKYCNVNNLNSPIVSSISI